MLLTPLCQFHRHFPADHMPVFEIKPCWQSHHKTICQSGVGNGCLLDCDWSATVLYSPWGFATSRLQIQPDEQLHGPHYVPSSWPLPPIQQPIMEGNALQYKMKTPNSSSRKCRQSFANQSHRRTSNSLKVNETYKRGAPAIHLNPQSNLLSLQRQTSLCAPSAVIGITNYRIFCPAYVLPLQTCAALIGYFTMGLVQFEEKKKRKGGVLQG